MLERDLQSDAVKRARQAGTLAYKFVSESRRNVPDYLFLFDGRLWFVEFKAPGKQARKAQLREHRILRSRGFIVDVIDDLNTFTQRLELFLFDALDL